MLKTFSKGTQALHFQYDFSAIFAACEGA